MLYRHFCFEYFLVVAALLYVGTHNILLNFVWIEMKRNDEIEITCLLYIHSLQHNVSVLFSIHIYCECVHIFFLSDFYL